MSEIILTNLSKLPERKCSELSYSSDIGDITGVYTNDAPVKYLISLIDKLGSSVGAVLAVRTDMAISAYSSLCDTLERYGAGKGIDIPVPKEIPTSEDSFADTISHIISLVHDGDRIWIDTTGGFRNSSYLLMAVMRILEYSHVRLEKAVYSNYESRTIEDVTGTYRLFDLINGVDGFTSYGNSDGLISFFGQRADPAVKATLSAMNDFSDAVALCRTSDLDNILARLNGSLAQLSAINPGSGGEMLFKSLSGAIRDKFAIGGKGSIDMTDVMLWCVENKMIQQAVTIYTEKTGEYLCGRAYTAAPEEISRIESIKHDHDPLYYSLFYVGLMAMEDTFIGKFLKKILSGSEKELTALLDSKNFNGLKKRAGNIIPDNAADRAALEKLFILRRTYYDDHGERLDPDAISDNLAVYKEAEAFRFITAKNFHGFLKQLSNTKQCSRFCKLLLGQQRYDDGKMNTIENLQRAYEGQDSYKILIPLDEMQLIMRDYHYVKNWLRNTMNHASGGDHTEEEKQYFSRYGYDTSPQPSLSYVTEIITKAVLRLKGV
ncbi:MAG: hypothetical protein IJ874_07080 [Ruminococcus sp.]|nr:hypothetical protein [Ruminococcus sp.]